MVYRQRGRTVGKVYLINNEEEPTPYLIRCPRLKVRWKPATSTVSARVPRGCMQASKTPGAEPFEFHTFTRFGGVKHSKSDEMPARTLDYRALDRSTRCGRRGIAAFELSETFVALGLRYDDVLLLSGHRKLAQTDIDLTSRIGKPHRKRDHETDRW